MDEEREIGTFEFGGAPLEAWINGRDWCVRFDGYEIEARTAGEALEEIMGDAKDFGERRRRDRLIIDILLWSQNRGYSGDPTSA